MSILRQKLPVLVGKKSEGHMFGEHKMVEFSW